MTFGETLQQYMKMSSMTHDQFSKAVGVSRQTVSSWVNGHSLPNQNKFDKLIDVISNRCGIHPALVYVAFKQ